MVTALKRLPSGGKRGQSGAVALEFALLFTLFFGVLYAVIAYSMALLITQGLAQAAAEGARESARLDPASFSQPIDYQNALTSLIESRVQGTLSWLPSKALTKIKANGISVTGPDYPGDPDASAKTGSITVKVSYVDYAGDPVIPFLTLPGLGTIPVLPNDLVGQASFRPN